jgi:2-(1,2-epoxy-1,2-dihydrophenyl)acetyl-CoA isomerase
VTELLQEREGGTLWLTLNRPERKNAVNPALRDAAIDALAAAEKDDEIRCVVLTGAGDAFCTGVDLATGAASQPPGPDGRPDAEGVATATREGMHRLAAAIWNFEKPTIAAVNGVAAGAGAQFALSCDLVLMAESARFIEIFVRRGLVVDSGGSWLLPRCRTHRPGQPGRSRRGAPAARRGMGGALGHLGHAGNRRIEATAARVVRSDPGRGHGC